MVIEALEVLSNNVSEGRYPKHAREIQQTNLRKRLGDFMEDQSLEELIRLHNIYRSDPRKYVSLMDERIKKDPDDSTLYSQRHDGWRKLMEWDKALSDINRSIELRPHPVTLVKRGNLHAEFGEHAEALNDYARAERLTTPEPWVPRRNWF